MTHREVQEEPRPWPGFFFFTFSTGGGGFASVTFSRSCQVALACGVSQDEAHAFVERLM